jgi:hypothetical protein
MLLARLASSPERRLVFAGFDPLKRTVNRRPIVEQQSYRVALPGSLLSDSGFASLFEGKVHRPGPKLSVAFTEGLRALRDRCGGLTEEYNAELRKRLGQEAEPEPMWILSSEQVGIRYSIDARNNLTPFSSVRDSRLTADALRQLSARGVLAATYDRADLTWRSDVRFDYQRTSTAQGVTESQDLLQPETELRFKSLRLSSGEAAYAFVPLLGAAYETEFTPSDVFFPDTSVLAGRWRRSYLRGIAGIGLFPERLLKELRLGFVAQNDFAKLRGGTPLQLGGLASLKLERELGPLRAQVQGEVLYFPPRGERDPVDRDVLGLRTQVVGTLTVPVSDWFELGVSVDWLGARGKVPSTRTFGQSLQLGATLQVNRTWKPGYE